MSMPSFRRVDRHLIALLGLLAVLGPAPCARAEEAGNAGTAATPPAGAAGMRVYVDPATGRPTVPPPGARAPATPAMSRSSQGLVQVPGTTPAGGVMVDLKGRFRHAMTATPGADGKTTVGCVPDRSGEKE